MWIGESPSCALRLSYGLQDTPPSATGQRSYLPDVESVEGTSTRTNTSCLCLTTAALPTEAPGSGGFYPSVPLFLSPRQLKPPGAALGQHGTVTYDATRDVPRGEAQTHYQHPPWLLRGLTERLRAILGPRPYPPLRSLACCLGRGCRCSGSAFSCWGLRVRAEGTSLGCTFSCKGSIARVWRSWCRCLSKELTKCYLKLALLHRRECRSWKASSSSLTFRLSYCRRWSILRNAFGRRRG